MIYAVSGCFHDPPNFDTDYRVSNMRTWFFNACVYAHGQGTPIVGQHIIFDLEKLSFSCPDRFWTLNLWISSLVRSPLSQPVTPHFVEAQILQRGPTLQRFPFFRELPIWRAATLKWVPLGRGVPHFAEEYRGVPHSAEGCRGTPHSAEGCRGVPHSAEGCRGVPHSEERSHILQRITEGSHIQQMVAEGSHILQRVTEGSHILQRVAEGSCILQRFTEGSHILQRVTEGSHILQRVAQVQCKQTK